MSVTRFPHGVSSFGQTLHGGGLPMAGRAYHVRKEADDNYSAWYDNMQMRYPDGTDAVHTTITSAMDDADEWDVIYVYPGTWNETATLTMKKGQKLIGAHGKLLGTRGARISATSTSFNLVTIDVDMVEIANISFLDWTSTYGISIAGTSTTYNTYIHDCYFYDAGSGGGSNNTSYGIHTGAASIGVNTRIEDCDFFKGNTLLTMNGYRETVRRCTFEIMNTYVGIQYVQTAQGAQNQILDNRFLAVESASQQHGIQFTGTPSAGSLIIDGNHFVNFASADYACELRTGWTGLNYWGVTALPITT